MKFWREKRKLCIIVALTALLISAGLIWAGRRSSELSVSTEEICSNLSSQSSFSFIKTSLHKTIRGTVEEDTIKFTYLSEPTGERCRQLPLIRIQERRIFSIPSITSGRRTAGCSAGIRMADGRRAGRRSFHRRIS